MPRKSGTGRRRSGRAAASRKASAEEDELDLGSDKLYFKIGEVSEIVGVPAYVLRYWETEFKAVKPQKSRTQQRVYRRRDVATLLRIKHLLYEKKFTIAGARQQLKEGGTSIEVAPPSGLYLARQSLKQIRSLLDETRAMVTRDDLDRSAADPAAYVAAAGGAQAILDGVEPEATVFHRPQRDPR